ncbi:Hsp20/alpha crystallin family protein Ecym_4737 [Eremothecium cymbalariae DBVPG|uniref:SHSP domain-containing protein n=1 Tax=Eremothecium cymbalariae (strain CBS 270.75 / DBVPG 7215 / KCTC 17166 / NRRL Y-17582) TaxID=931890 RepID=G8JSN2_ERECY|nr:hypothetical protein Ecym_4737 [Eremothecium cymbalariae DBVPG\
MSLSSPFFEFFDAINNEVAAFNNRLVNVARPATGALIKAGKNRVLGRNWPLEDTGLVPPVDMMEYHEKYEVNVSVPGMLSKEDINVEYHSANNEIIISGEIPIKEAEEGTSNWLLKERATGSFRRALEFPERPGIDVEKISGSYENGVLVLTIPKLSADDSAGSVKKITIGEKK